ncbi:MAG: hypothetical protein OXT65_04150 [Alphaproteobacteria bacterium]|nr:hypothetical protein [Alphaproteobacteria bacterium]
MSQLKNTFNPPADEAPVIKTGPQVLIFLDMDDVLTRWTDYAEKTIGHVPPEKRQEHYHTLGEDWWASIPAFDGARDFYDSLSARGPVRFLTGVKLEPGVYSGKARWIMNFIPEKGREILRSFMPVSSRDKQLLAGPGRILVDDRVKNIEEWRKAGGIGILHTGNYAESISKVDDAISQMHARVKADGPDPGV